jgi:hypothetical protein
MTAEFNIFRARKRILMLKKALSNHGVVSTDWPAALIAPRDSPVLGQKPAELAGYRGFDLK